MSTPLVMKTISSYSGLSRFLGTCEETGLEIDRIPGIPSPYSYSPRWPVYKCKGKYVFIREVAHKYYKVFVVPTGMLLHPAEEG